MRSPERQAEIVVDRYRAFVFPNRIREQRRQHGFPKLMALSERLAEIPYIRLSKIERGEVVARASELRRIARVLDIEPTDLLIDVTASEFDTAIWAEPFKDSRPSPYEEERFAVMLAAALRVLRSGDPGLTIAALDKDYGLPPVILSRLENAYKTFDRWNADTVGAVCTLFGAANEATLRAQVNDRYHRGELDAYVGQITNPSDRIARSREAIETLRRELTATGRADLQSLQGDAAVTPVPVPRAAVTGGSSGRHLTVLGTPLPGGLIAAVPTGVQVPAPFQAGPNAFSLRVCRATLGVGLPANAIVIVDPDRAPTAGSLAAIRSPDGYRLVSVTFDRAGATKGYSVTPELEVDIDALDPADVHAVIAAVFA